MYVSLGLRRSPNETPESEHFSRPWRIHRLTADFRLEDVWALPTPGGPDDFPRLVRRVATVDEERQRVSAVRVLFAVRQMLGECSVGTGRRPRTTRCGRVFGTG